MKIKKFSLVILLVTCLITNLFLFRLDVFADVPNDRVAVKHTGSFTNNLSWVLETGEYYYYIQDSTGVPNSTLLNPNFFLTSDGQTFQSYSSYDVIALVFNKGVGAILKDTKLGSIFDGFLSDLSTVLSGDFCVNGVYDSNNDFLGFAINDISNCYYALTPLANTDYTIPSDFVDSVRNYYDYYILLNPDVAPYFTYIGVDPNTVISGFTYTGNMLTNADRKSVV